MKKSGRSKVSFKRVEIGRRRLTLETEKGLAEAEIEEGELCSVQSKSSRKLYTESLGESSRNEVVQEWMKKCGVHSDHPPREKLEKSTRK
ncbi:hypothetical protein JTB14_016381 [Gonioctena quinquepunctata]|nr:hypothetical protein JTB14_016381 [Gonioctena quinquepunctata]